MHRSQRQQPASPSIASRSPRARRRMNPIRGVRSREEKVYAEIMGNDSKVKPAYEHFLIELTIDSEDILDK